MTNSALHYLVLLMYASVIYLIYFKSAIGTNNSAILRSICA